MTRLGLLVAAAAAALLVGCGAPAPTPAAPAFDTIEFTADGGGYITYDAENGLAATSRTAGVASTYPFTKQVALPHGPRNVAITVSSTTAAAPTSCMIRINGAVVAAHQTPSGGSRCAYQGTP